MHCSSKAAGTTSVAWIPHLQRHHLQREDRIVGNSSDRSDSTSHRLPTLLVEQPVINTSYLAQHLGISDRAARRAINQACGRAILTKVGNVQRGTFYQTTDLITILEDASSVPGIRRMVAS